ncbi:MAG: hypothetical protein F9K29_00795 [Hyphomicrobiaceae bacterium]|nr:MAG: hypothetical protein F9K29_00795 [Hyphomicrobiaceae bacterium]
MTYVLATLAGAIGAALGWAAAAALALLIGTFVGASNFEGALGMFAVWAIGPAGGLIGLVAGGWLVLRKRGHRSFSAVALRIPLIVAAVAAIGAGVLWYLYETRPNLGTSSSGTPRLDFEIRLPPGIAPTGQPSAIRIELNTERNRMPGQVFDKGFRQDGDRMIMAGAVELHYRSSWRLLEVTMAPGEPARIFDLKLPSRPRHMKHFGPWRRVDFIAAGSEQPRPAPASEGFEIRTRVVYRDVELVKENAGEKR